MSQVPVILGFIASALVLATFWMRAPIRLRQVAIGSNVAFLTYGVLTQAWPIAVLHALLLPLNFWRLHEMKTLTRKVEVALTGDLSMDWLRPFMQPRRFSAGDVIFRKGDEQTDVYYIVSGTVALPEIDVLLNAGQLIGEMAIFSPNLQRSLSAVCVSDVEMLYMPNDAILRLYFQNPEFGLFLVRLITQRLLLDTDILGKRVDERTNQLEKLRALTDVDETTGVANRRGFDARLHREWARAVRPPAPLSLIVIRIEDRHDRHWTDDMLTQLTFTLASRVSRGSDFLARHNSEFVAMLPSTALEGAEALAEEMRLIIEALEVPVAKIWRGDLRVWTGVASRIPDRSITPETLVDDAYEALRSDEAPHRVGSHQSVLMKL